MVSAKGDAAAPRARARDAHREAERFSPTPRVADALRPGVQIEQQSDDWAQIAVQGPKAAALVDSLSQPKVMDLGYYHFRPATVAGIPGCIVARTGYTGEDGFEVMVPNALGVTLWEEFIAKGAVPCGLGARYTLRLEAAMPLYGHELTEETDPLSAGLGWAVKLDKVEFVGRSALLMAREQLGRSGRQRVGLMLEGKRAAREGCPVLLGDGRAVGTVTSGSFSPTLQKSIAMASVDVTHAAVGTRVLADVDPTGFTDETFGLPTVRDILAELDKPGRDPRPAFATGSHLLRRSSVFNHIAGHNRSPRKSCSGHCCALWREALFPCRAIRRRQIRQE